MQHDLVSQRDVGGRVSLIVAMDRHRLIGDAKGLPWHLPADLRRFRKLTTGKPIVMGRKTLDQIGRALPNRVNVVLTRQSDFAAEGCLVVHSMEEALKVARRVLPELHADEVMIVGGADVYRQALPFATCVYLTIVEGEFTGNTYFPPSDSFRGQVVQTESLAADEKNRYAHRFLIVDRCESGKLLEELI
jgi:dihydrofolate reductase